MAPAAIRIEMDDEIVATRKRGAKRLIIAAVAACGAGIVLGSVLGGAMAARESNEISVTGAQALVKEVSESNVQAKTLQGLVKEVVVAMTPKAVDPKDQGKEKDAAAVQAELAETQAKLAAIATKLGDVHIPFNGSSLAGKGIGRFQAATLAGLLGYAASGEEINILKERLQKRLTGSGVKAYLAQRADPKFNLTVSVHTTPSGPWAVVRPVLEPFSVRQKDAASKDVDWPSDIKVQAGQTTAEFSRYTKGDPMRRAIPIDPQSEDAFCPNPSKSAITLLVNQIGTLLDGSEGGNGMISAGDRLVGDLGKIGAQ